MVGTSSMKVVGASWPGFHIGSFTSPTGKGSVNMYGTRIWGELLLIRTRWETIGITPEDSEQFLNELNRLKPGLDGDIPPETETQETLSLWKDKIFLSTIIFSGIVFIATGLFLAKTIPVLPDKVPMHYNLAGEVDRYGSPGEIFIPFSIGVLVDIIMIGITTFFARNNRMSMYMTGFASVFIALIFSMISISMVLSK